jgi:pantetheine-phosphate adenylyltransferase
MKKAIYAGTFDPLTNGHLWMIERGAAMFDELVVGIGVNPDKNTMFTLEERLEMLKEVVAPCPNVSVSSYSNKFLIQFAKDVGAEFVIRGIRNTTDFGYEKQMRYVNQDLCPDVTTIFLIPDRSIAEISSSLVKGLVGPEGWENIVSQYVPNVVLRLIRERRLKYERIANAEPE